MSAPKHTAGPWETAATDDSLIVAGRTKIAQTYEVDGDVWGAANARLIASASDLLEALRPFADVLADVGEDEDNEDLYRAMTKAHRRAPAITVGHLRCARAAIAKATGETGQ